MRPLCCIDCHDHSLRRLGHRLLHLDFFHSRLHSSGLWVDSTSGQDAAIHGEATYRLLSNETYEAPGSRVTFSAGQDCGDVLFALEGLKSLDAVGNDHESLDIGHVLREDMNGARGVEPDGLVIAATPSREDARDVVVTRDGTALSALPAGARVGTGSPRRIAQALRKNPGLDVRDIRGNVDSRLARVRDGDLDAVILAAAGISRLGGDLGGLEAEYLGLAEWPTAPGQGSLAIETRADIEAQAQALRSMLVDADPDDEDDLRTELSVLLDMLGPVLG